MSTTYLTPDFDGNEFDTFPVDYEEQEPEDCSERKPIRLVCPNCGLTLYAEEVTIFNVNSDFVFDSIENTREGNYYFDTGKCSLCDTELERRYNEVKE